jgi:hypothetical protein
MPGQAYTAGQTVFIVAKFASSICNLPQPINTNPGCTATITLGLHTREGLTCLPVSVAPSVQLVERQYAISFLADPALDTGTGIYNHWVFPLNVAEGMFTSNLRVSGLLISSNCSVSGSAVFNNLDLIPNPNSLLSPNVTIDAMPPTIVNVYAGKGAGSYTVGAVMYIVVEFSKDVGFPPLPSKYSPAFAAANASYTLPSGLPYLNLNSKSFATLDGYAGSSLRKLAFFYRVGFGENTPEDGQLEVPAGETIQLNGADIYSLSSGQQADLTTMPLPGSKGQLPSPAPARPPSNPLRRHSPRTK